jgi:hypothetical protein
MKASNSDIVFAPLLQRRTILFMLVFATLGMVGSVVSGKMRTPRYLANLVLRVGEVGYVTNAGLVQRSVEPPKELVERLRYEHRLKGIGRRVMPLPHLHRARLSRTDNNLVVLESHGATEQQATDFLRKLSGKLIGDHSLHFSDADILWEKRHEQLRKHLRIIDGVIDEQLKTLAQEPSGNDQIHALRLMQMGILTSHRAKADEDLHLLNISRSRFYTAQTRTVQEPDNAVTVGLSTIALAGVGGFAGLVTGCLLALLTLRRRDDEDA